MSGWREGALSEVAEIVMGQSPTGETCNSNGNGVPLLNGPTEFGIRFPTPVQFTTDSKKTSEINDILFCVRGSTTGRMNWANQKFALGRGLAAIRHKNGEQYRYFVRGIIDFNLPSLLASATGSTFPNVSRDQLAELEIFIPPLREQKAISAVLSSLDDKIDLLHRQNQTLEAMAEILFRQWFVEEEQDGFEEIPLEQFFDFMEGPGIRNWQYTESGTPFINIRLISNGDIDISKASFVSNEEANGKYSHFHLKEGDMIVSTSGTLGKNAIVRSYHLPLILNTSVIRFRPRDGRSYSFVYQYLNSRLFQEHLESAASGSVQANFGPTHLKQMTLSKPPQDVLDKYLLQADPIYNKLRVNQAQIKTLEKLRDNLLPKLMSGEVRVVC